MNIENIIEEFIRNRRKGMINPELHWFFSSYSFKGMDYFEKGWLLIDEEREKKGRIIGEINEFYGVILNKERRVAVDGFFEKNNNKITMELLKLSPYYSKSLIYYLLKKSEEGIDGVYNGKFFLLVINLKKDLTKMYLSEMGK